MINRIANNRIANLRAFTLIGVMLVSGWCCAAQTNVERIDRYGYGGHALTSIDMHGQVGLACGDLGTMLRSTDNGSTWSSVPSQAGDSVMLNSVSWANNDVAVAVGSEGCIVRTSQGGTVWTKIPSGTREFLERVVFANEQHAVCVGTGGTALISTDGGSTWTRTQTGTTLGLHDVCVLEDGSFLAVGDGGMIATLPPNSTTWSVRSGTSTYDFHACLFTTQQRGWVGIAHGVLATTDGGTTWSRPVVGFDRTITSITAAGPYTVATGQFDGTLYYATDGQQWKVLHIGDTVVTRGCTRKPGSTDEILVVGDDGLIRSVSVLSTSRTEHGTFNAPFYFDHLRTSNNELWCVGYGGAIHHMTASGTWTSRGTSSVTPLFSGIASMGTVLCATTDSAAIYRSDDNGNTWMELSLPAPAPSKLTAISAMGSFWCVGRSAVFRSTEGSTWQPAGSFVDRELFDVAAIDLNTAFVCGSDGLIARTSNGGQDWVQLPSNVSTSLLDADFDASGNGIVVGQYGVALVTTTNGASFEPLGSPASMTAFIAVDHDAASGTVAIATIDGYILTRQGPNDAWNMVNTSTQLTDVELGPGVLTAVGEGGSVIRVPLNPTTVQENRSVPTLLISPNPATNMFTVALSDQFVATSISARALDGRIVLDQHVVNGATALEIDVHTWPPGLYTVELYDEEQQILAKGTVIRIGSSW